MRVRVQTYSGYKGDQRPLRFTLGDRDYEVQDVLDQWYGPDEIYFRVRASDGHLYILRRSIAPEQEEAQWTLESFRASDARA